MSALPAPLRGLPSLMEAKLASRGLAFPWWIPVVSIVCELGATVIALVQRAALLPPAPVSATLVLVLGAHAALFAAPGWVGCWADTVVIGAATWWLLVTSGAAVGPADSAPVLLIILAAVVTARDGIVPGLAVTALSIAMIFLAWQVAHLSSPGVVSLEIVLGLTVGVTLRWQMRALTAERAARAGEYARATLEERQRIAREIHDLVAHSLSVTLLQVAGAREALRDGDVGDALEALDDAEAVARRAMADIRGTVSTLSDTDEAPRPLPSARQIPELVAEFAAAGLDVTYDGPGRDLAHLDGAAGLGLYRITQEALANVAKHAPGARTRVEVRVGFHQTRLAVRNSLPGVRARQQPGGSGLPGMAARAAGLGAAFTAGPADDGEAWEVEVRLAPGACVIQQMTTGTVTGIVPGTVTGTGA